MTEPTAGPADDTTLADRLAAMLLESCAPELEVSDAVGDIQSLIDLSGDVGLRPPGARISLREVAARSGVPVERAQHLCLVAGLPASDVDGPSWFESDIAWMETAALATDLLGNSATLAILRIAGASMAQLANASSSAFRVNVVSRPLLDDEPEVMAVRRNLGTGALVQGLVDVLAQLFRHHIRLTVRNESVAAGEFGELRFMGVGFVDLASSTELGERVTAGELAGIIADFDTAAFETATRHGARVVKTIGDEVMLCALDPAAVCRAAIDLVAYCQRHHTLTGARGGVAAGELLEQNGDCYGPVVNRAARFTAAAADGTVMVDATIAAAVPPDLQARPHDPIEHRGLGPLPWWEMAPAPGPRPAAPSAS